MALDFSPASGADRVRYSSRGNFNGGARGILIWVRPDVDTMSNNYMFSSHVSGGSGSVNFLLQWGTSGGSGANHIRAASFGGVTCEITSAAGVLPTGEWSLVGFNWDGTSKYSSGSGKLYANSSTPLTAATAGSTGTFGSTSGDWLFGNNGNANRAPDAGLYRGIVLNREFTQSEYDLVLGGFNPLDVFEESAILLGPSSEFNEDWDDDINSATATITGATQIADPFLGFLVTSNLSSGTPVLGTPTLTEVSDGDDLVVGDLVGSVPILDTPSLGQTHALATGDLTSSAPVLSGPLVDAGVVVQGDFEGATINAGSCTVGGTALEPSITLVNYLSQDSIWRHMVARLNNVTGLTSLAVVIDSTNMSYDFISAQPLWWKYVGDDGLIEGAGGWNKFETISVVSGVMTATSTVSFTGDIIISEQPSVMPSELASYFATTIAANSEVTSLVSGEETTGRYAQLPATTGFGGFVIPALYQHAIKVGDGPDKILIIIGQHPNEMIGTQSAVEMIEKLIDGSALSLRVLARFQFHFVEVNPQGRYGGNQDAATWQSTQPYVNCNREWDTSLLTTVNEAKTYISGTVGTSDVLFLIDTHNRLSGTSGQESSFFFIDSRPLLDEFFTAFNAAYSGTDFIEFAGSTDAGICPNYYYDTYGISGNTLEQAQGTDPTFDAYREAGSASIIAIDTMLTDGDFGYLLTANGLVAGTPTLGNPTLAEDTGINELTTGDLIAAAPVLDAPSMGQTHALTSGDLTCALPVLSNSILLTASQVIRLGQIGVSMIRHFDLDRGNSLSFNGVVRAKDGTPIDLTDDTLVWKIGTTDFRKTSVTLTEGDGVEITDAENGEYTITLEGAKTDVLRAGNYRHRGEGVYSTLPYGFVSGNIRLRKDLP